jgi:hypothetical protein
MRLGDGVKPFLLPSRRPQFGHFLLRFLQTVQTHLKSPLKIDFKPRFLGLLLVAWIF